jgi:hypothetical protein
MTSSMQRIDIWSDGKYANELSRKIEALKAYLADPCLR